MGTYWAQGPSLEKGGHIWSLGTETWTVSALSCLIHLAPTVPCWSRASVYANSSSQARRDLPGKHPVLRKVRCTSGVTASPGQPRVDWNAWCLTYDVGLPCGRRGPGYT